MLCTLYILQVLSSSHQPFALHLRGFVRYTFCFKNYIEVHIFASCTKCKDVTPVQKQMTEKALIMKHSPKPLNSCRDFLRVNLDNCAFWNHPAVAFFFLNFLGINIKLTTLSFTGSVTFLSFSVNCDCYLVSKCCRFPLLEEAKKQHISL